MPAALLCAQLTDQELTLRQQARTGVRRTLAKPAATARALGLAICEVEAGCAQPASSSAFATLACGRRSPTASSGPEGHRSMAPVPCGSGSRSSPRA
jgi:hypothetical protein